MEDLAVPQFYFIFTNSPAFTRRPHSLLHIFQAFPAKPHRLFFPFFSWKLPSSHLLSILQKGLSGITAVLLSVFALNCARLTHARVLETKNISYVINQSDTKVHTVSNSMRGSRHLRTVLEAPITQSLNQDVFRKFY